MRAFNHPSSCFEASLLLDGLRFFSTALDMRRESKLVIQFPHVVVIVAFILADALGFFLRRLRSLHLNVLECVSNHFHVVPIGSINGHADWNAVRFGQHASLRAVLSSVRGVWTRFFPRPTEPSTWHRPSPAMSNPVYQVLRSREVPAAKTPERHLLEPTLGIDGRLRNKNKCPYHPESSIGIPCEAQTELHSSRPDPARVDYGNPTDAACVAAATAPFDSTTRPEATSHHFLQPNPLRFPSIRLWRVSFFFKTY